MSKVVKLPEGDLHDLWNCAYDAAPIPTQLYILEVLPGKIKGPHCHTARVSRFVCLHGRVLLIMRDKQMTYTGVWLDGRVHNVATVPCNVAAALYNFGQPTAEVLNFPHGTPWSPSYDDRVPVGGWDPSAFLDRWDLEGIAS